MLGKAELNKDYFVVNICTELNEATTKRLLELGFVEGAKIRVIQKSVLKEVLLVEINNCTFAIRENIAKFVVRRGYERTNTSW